MIEFRPIIANPGCQENYSLARGGSGPSVKLSLDVAPDGSPSALDAGHEGYRGSSPALFILTCDVWLLCWNLLEVTERRKCVPSPDCSY